MRYDALRSIRGASSWGSEGIMAALKDQLNKDLIAAMKAHDETAKTTIRAAKAAIMNAEVAGENHELSGAEELKILTREVHTRLESAETYQAAGRAELAANENAEAEILKNYLPAPLSAEELQAIVDRVITEASADEKPTMKQMGQLVKAVNEHVQGRAEGKTVADLVRKAIA